MSPNPLLSDRLVQFLLYDVLDAPSLSSLPAFAEHGRETFDLVLSSYRRLAREVLYPAYKAMDLDPPRFDGKRIHVHALLRPIHAQLVALDVIAAARPREVGGQELPFVVATLANAYLMAANLSAYAYFGLTTGAAHLLEAFGGEFLRKEFMTRLYRGEWMGTMALTEPHAGSSLADVRTRATPTATSSDDGIYRIQGSKIFISGADHDLTENIVQMTLARIDGAPAGIKGVSLFAVPNRRPETSAPGSSLVDNDVSVAGMIHKIGWRGLPSLALEFGERGDCHGWLVGKPHQGISYMFQMMNEARIMVGVNGAATASVAYHEALAYARDRPQGRPLGAKDPLSPQVPILAHADVRRMLVRQKAIVEGSLALLATAAYQSDLAAHAATQQERRRASLLLDLLTPVAKSFPAERGFEANALAVQVHGGYGYTSEYPVEAWLRDQKLNSIHEGTTGIHSLDLLGRKVVAEGGAPLGILGEEIGAAIEGARSAGIDEALCVALERAFGEVTRLTHDLAMRGAGGDVEGMLRHSADYLELFSIVVIAWQWLRMASVARRKLTDAEADETSRSFHEGLGQTTRYWFATELGRVPALAVLCREDDSYARMKPEWF